MLQLDTIVCFYATKGYNIMSIMHYLTNIFIFLLHFL